MKKIFMKLKLRKGYDIAEKLVPMCIPDNTNDDILGWLDAGYDVELSLRITKETEVKEDDF